MMLKLIIMFTKKTAVMIVKQIASLLILLCLVLAMPYGSAFAQQSAESPQTGSAAPYTSGPLNFLMEQENEEGINYMAVFEQLPEDIRVDLMEEVTREYQKCENQGVFSKYYNCECVAIAYLDERIKQGPGPHSQTLLRQVVTQCPFPEGTAGISFRKCTDMMMMTVVGDLDKFCTCFANFVSKKFTERPSQHSEYISFLHRQAMGECGYQQEMDDFRRIEENREIYR